MLTGVIIDSREGLIKDMDFGVPKAVTTLETGDLWASCSDGQMLVIERKTPTDLLKSIADGRLSSQVSRMRSMSSWCYLIVTGALTPSPDGKTIANGKVQGWSWASVQGALLNVQEQGVNVITISHDGKIPETLHLLAARERGQRVIPPAPPSRIMTPAEQMLTALPGIGISRAQSLLAEFDRPATALVWLTELDTIAEIAGIGNGTKDGVRKSLGLTQDESLTLWSDLHQHYQETYK